MKNICSTRAPLVKHRNLDFFYSIQNTESGEFGENDSIY